MTALELINLIENGEDSKHQFKETVKDSKKLADEMVAFTNSQGGLIIIGIDNSGKIRGLSRPEIDKINQHISNADEGLIEGSTIEDIDLYRFSEYFLKIYKRDFNGIEHSLETLLEKLNLAKYGKLNLAGLLLFGKNPSRFRPAFIIKAVNFFGNDPTHRDYRDSEDIEGVLERQYKDGMAFLLRNLKKTRQGQPINSLGILEVSQVALEEILQNAIIHRDYFKNAPIRIFIFDNRIEIISPGKLTNSLTVENIKFGNSAIRNALIASYATRMLPYRGLGLGIMNALKEQPNIEFYNDVEGEQFKVVIPRPEEKG
jgi:ATP-dependent DNA helicase RecG